MDAKMVYGLNSSTIEPVRMGETNNQPVIACDHPADSLKPLDLIPDACMCSQCGAIFKHYNLRQATLMGIEEGWTRLNPELLQAEIYLALRPMFELAKASQRVMGALKFEEVEAWADFAPHNYPVIRQLEKAE